MKALALSAFPRTLARRGGVKRLRQTGRVPAIIYGRQGKPQNLEVDSRDLHTLIHHSVTENLLIDLSVKEDSRAKRLALVQDVQHHPLSGQVLHVDFHEVTEDEKVTIMAAVETVGEPVGVKTGGGTLEHVLFKVKVRAFPKDLPEVIHVDVSNLDIGQSIHLGDLLAPPGVEILGDKKVSVLSVAAPITEAEEAAATAAAAGPAEVEMIKEKKEEGAAPAGAAGKAAEKAPAGEKAGAEKAPAAAAGAEKKAEKKK
jgi:large subunit ribosomal protein L25